MVKRAIVAILGLVVACGGERAEERPAEPAAREAPAAEVAAPAAADPNEACAQVIVVAWSGAEHAAPSITRSESDARARAEELRQRVDRGDDFALVARAESDAASSGRRGGLIGTYVRDEWPALHAPIRDVVFGLQVGQTSDVVSAPYGYVIARRCAVEKVHTRHILVRYRGARNAGDDVTRSREEAEALARELRGRVVGPGVDFASVARQHSEDGSAANGGDLGEVGRGRLAQPYEDAAYALEAGAVSEVVESEFGFHVIQRVR